MTSGFQEAVYGQKTLPISLLNTQNIAETAVLLRDFIRKTRRGGRIFVNNIFQDFNGTKSKPKLILFELCFAILMQDYSLAKYNLSVLESLFKVDPHFKHFVSKILEDEDLLKNEDVLSMFAMILNKMYK